MSLGRNREPEWTSVVLRKKNVHKRHYAPRQNASSLEQKEKKSHLILISL